MKKNRKLAWKEKYYGKGTFEITSGFHFINETFNDIKSFKEALLYNRFTASFTNKMLFNIRLQFYKQSNILGVFIYDSKDLFLNHYVIKCPVQEQFVNSEEELKYYEYLGFRISQLFKINIIWMYTTFNELVYSARSHKYNIDSHPFFDNHLDYLKFSKEKLLMYYEQHQSNFDNFKIQLMFKYNLNNYLIRTFILGFCLNDNLQILNFKQNYLENTFIFPSGLKKSLMVFSDEQKPILQCDYFYNRYYGFTLVSELFHPIYYRYVKLLLHQKGHNLHFQPIRANTIESVWRRNFPNKDFIKESIFLGPDLGEDGWLDYGRSLYWKPDNINIISKSNYLNYFFTSFKFVGQLKCLFYYVPCYIILRLLDSYKIFDILSFHYILKGLIFGGLRFLSFSCVKFVKWNKYNYGIKVGFKYPSILNFKFRLRWLPKLINNMIKRN